MIFDTDMDTYSNARKDIYIARKKGVENQKGEYLVIKDRKEAIEFAISNAKENDIVLILGKGIDNYMAIKNKYKKYCDKDVIEKILKKK